uniref:Uncharacterized protein n=1 Tax=Micrurus lemniscatus lemniscatus TaxID=129467 RepID=A0A2D4JPB5_MICLE
MQLTEQKMKHLIKDRLMGIRKEALCSWGIQTGYLSNLFPMRVQELHLDFGGLHCTVIILFLRKTKRWKCWQEAFNPPSMQFQCHNNWQSGSISITERGS